MRLFVGAVFAALTLILLAVPRASADGCRKVVSHGYVAPIVHAPHVNYGHGFNHGYSHHDVVLKPYAIPVAIVAQTLYQVAPELAYARINQELADQAAEKAVRKAVEEMMRRPPPKEVLNENPIPPALKDPEEARGKDKPAGDLVQAMVNSKCLKCHGAGSDFDLSDLTKLSREDRLEMVHRIMTDDPKLRMPRTGPAVTGDELNATHAFVTAAPKKTVAQK